MGRSMPQCARRRCNLMALMSVSDKFDADIRKLFVVSRIGRQLNSCRKPQVLLDLSNSLLWRIS